MNVQQIFNKVALLIHHDLTNSQLVDELNEILKMRFRQLPLPDKFYRFTTTDTPYYDLPADCAEDRIRVVTVDDVEYRKVAPETQTVDGPFCMVLAGKLYVHPNEAGKDAVIYYRPGPITIVNTSQTPNFPEDYHNLLVYDLARYVAEIQRDVDLVNNFQARADEIERQARIGIRKMGVRRVKETMVW